MILVIFDKCSFVSIAKVLRNCFGCKKKRLCQGPFSFLRIYVIRRRRGGKKCPLFDGRSFCIVMGSSMIRLHADWPRWRTLSSLLLPLGVQCKDFDLTRLDGKIFNRIIINWIEQEVMVLFFFFFLLLDITHDIDKSLRLHDFVINFKPWLIIVFKQTY